MQRYDRHLAKSHYRSRHHHHHAYQEAPTGATESDYPPLEELRRPAAQGLSGEQIAMCLACAERPLWLRMSGSLEVRAAFHERIAAGVDKASAKLWELIDQGNIARLIFYLGSRGGWRAAASRVEVTVHHPSARYPMITSHVLDMAREHSLLLDSLDRT